MTKEELRYKIVSLLCRSSGEFTELTFLTGHDQHLVKCFKIADVLIEAGMTFHDEQANDLFASELVNIKNGKLPDISDKKYDGLVFVNGGFGGKK